MKKIFSIGLKLFLIFIFFNSTSQDLSISGGNTYSMSVCQDGKIFVWGNIVTSAGTLVKATIPVLAPASEPDIIFTQADAGSGYHVLAIDCNKKVWSWGSENSKGQIGQPLTVTNTKGQLQPVIGLGGQGQLSGVTYVSGADKASFALLANGRLVSWGDNGKSQLGRPTTGSTDYIPDFVLTAPGVPLENVIQVDAGDQCAYALTADGTVYSWGDNLNQELGRYATGPEIYAKPVLKSDKSPLTNIKSISGGDTHGLARDKNGNVWSWGGNWASQLGRGVAGTNSSFADLVTGVGGTGILSNVREIAAGQATSMILVNNEGNIVTFGSNCLYQGAQIPGSGGVLGQGSTACSNTLFPAYVKDINNNTLKNIVQISDGDAVIYAVSAEGDLYVLGNNLNGELGLGDQISRGFATKMPKYGCDLTEPCPKPDLGADIPACNETQLTNVVLNSRYSRNYIYKWYYRINKNGSFTQLTTSDTNIYKPTKLGQYMVEVQRSYNNCSTCGIGYDTVSIDQPEPPFKLNNGIFCKEPTLNFSVSGNGEFNWYTSQTGGTLDPAFANKTSISVSRNTLTPILDGTDTVYNMYVEDVSIKKGTALATTIVNKGTQDQGLYNIAANRTDADGLKQKTVYFDVIQTVQLDSISLKLFNFGNTDNKTVTISILDNLGVQRSTTQTILNVVNGAPSAPIYQVFAGGFILAPGTGYRLVINGGTADIAFYETSPNISYPANPIGDLSGYVRILGSKIDYGQSKPFPTSGIVNWKFTAQGGYPCGRAKVSITKDCPCNKPAITISSSTGQTSFCSNVQNQSLTLKGIPTPATPIIDPFIYLYQWYKNGSPINTKTKDTLFVNSNSGEAEYTIRIGHTSLQRAKCYTELTQKISIQPKITNNIINGNDTICSGGSPKKITGSDPLGGTGTISYVWLQSANEKTGYTPINSSNTKDLSPGALITSTYFRRLVLRGVCSDTSSAVRIVVDPLITDPGAFTSNPPGTFPVICSGSKIPNLVFSNVTGGSSPLKYQWESSINNIDWTILSQETGPTLINFPILTQKTYFRRKVNSLRCNSVSAAVLVGVDTSITDNNFDSNSQFQTICIGGSPSAILGNIPKGGVKPYIYKWQESNSETGPFTDIANSNTKDFTPPAITVTTFYKRVVTSSGACANDVSTTTAKVTVDPAITSGSIQPALPLICAGTSPVLINLVSPTGGTRPYKFKWQILNGITWTDIPTSNDSDSSLSNAPSINDETQFRRIVLSSLKCQNTSDPVSVKTTGQMRPGEIRLTDSSVCAGNIPGIIKSISPATGGTGNTGIEYQWESSPDAISWTAVNNATLDSLLPGALTVNTYYRRKASNGTGVCDEVFAGPVLIKQYIKLNPGTIQNSDTSICDGSNAVIRSTMAPSNGSPLKTYSWSIAYGPNFVFKDTAVNTPSLSLSSLSNTLKVKRIVKDACGTDTSANTVTINVFPKEVVSINITTDLSPTFCSDKPLEVRVSVQKAGNRSIVWEYNGQRTSSVPDSILVITKPVNGAKVKAISSTDPRLFCTTPSAASKEITLNINDPISGNSFGGKSQSLCLGSVIDPILGGITSGGVQPSTYQWLSSEQENGPYSPVTGADGSSFTPTISKTTFYKRIVSSTGVCKADTSSDFFKIFIDQPVVPGKDSLLTTSLCVGDTLRFLNQTPASGGTVPLSYIWEFATTEIGPWSLISNQTNQNLMFPKNNLDSLKNTFYFRKTIKSEICSTIPLVFKAVICQKPFVKNFDLNRTCAFSDRTFNILDTVIDRDKGKGDFSTNGHKLKVVEIAKPASHGETVIFTPGTPGSFTYKSQPGFIGRDTVIFNICEEVAVNAQCVTKAFYFNVLPVNRPPIVKPELYSTYKNQAIPYGNILANDSDPDMDTIYVWPSIDKSYLRDSLIVPYKKYINTVLRMPLNGEVSMTYKGDLTYKPKEDFVGKDTAIFYVCDYTSSREYCTFDPFYCRKDTVVFDVKPYRIFIPDGFSPNNDGTNDLFVIRSEVPLNVDIKLYNRWGNLVYEKDGYQNDFDGRANRGIVIGDGLPDGTYYLHYNVNDKLIDPNPGFKYITISR